MVSKFWKNYNSSDAYDGYFTEDDNRYQDYYEEDKDIWHDEVKEPESNIRIEYKDRERLHEGVIGCWANGVGDKKLKPQKVFDEIIKSI